MFELISNKITRISLNTQIVFTVKSFVTLIFTILTLFYGFYGLVVVTKMSHFEKQIDNQVQQNQLFYQELSNINTALNRLNTSFEVLKEVQTTSTHINIPTKGQINMTYTPPIIVDTFNIKELLVTLNEANLQNYSMP